jgi:thiol-disulfide isomerase/thioredoxin
VRDTCFSGFLVLLVAAGCTSPSIERESSATANGPTQQFRTGCNSTVCGDGLSCIAERCFQGCVYNDECQIGICVEFRGVPGRWCVDEAQAAGHRGFIRGVDQVPEIGGGVPPINEGGNPNDDPDRSVARPTADGGMANPPAPSPPQDNSPPTQPEDDPEVNPPPTMEEDPPQPPEESEPDRPDTPGGCQYPQAPNDIRYQAVVPRLSWGSAFDGNGNEFAFDLQDFHCDPAYDQYSVMLVVVTAEWCGPCAEFMRNLRGDLANIQNSGGLVVFIETENSNNQPINSANANRVINRSIGDGAGIRVGDGDTNQGPRTVYNADIVTSFPTVFIVRRSDMRVIAVDGRNNASVNFAQIAREVGAPAMVDCEEPMEPNDNIPQARVLQPDGPVDGGVCGANNDFYTIEHAGDWTIDLSFRHADGDLDVYVWDPVNDVRLLVGGQEVGSDSASDNERFSHRGPALINVLGYHADRAAYTLNLTAN